MFWAACYFLPTYPETFFFWFVVLSSLLDGAILTTVIIIVVIVVAIIVAVNAFVIGEISGRNEWVSGIFLVLWDYIYVYISYVHHHIRERGPGRQAGREGGKGRKKGKRLRGGPGRAGYGTFTALECKGGDFLDRRS